MGKRAKKCRSIEKLMLQKLLSLKKRSFRQKIQTSAEILRKVEVAYKLTLTLKKQTTNAWGSWCFQTAW